MAVVVLGRSQCGLCQRALESGQNIELFPPGLFGMDEAAYELNDSGVHHSCLVGQSYGDKALARLKWYADHAKAGAVSSSVLVRQGKS